MKILETDGQKLALMFVLFLVCSGLAALGYSWATQFPGQTFAALLAVLVVGRQKLSDEPMIK